MRKRYQKSEIFGNFSWLARSRKAQYWSMSYIGKLILTLLFLISALFITKKLGDMMSQGYDKQICQTTVVANSKIRVPVAQIQNFDLNCPTRYVTIGLDEITYESGKSKTTEDVKCKKSVLSPKGTENTPESKRCFLNTANGKIAGLIFDCWDQFGAGQLRVFSNYNLNRQCLVCARVEFKKDVKDMFNLGIAPISLSEYKGSTTNEDYTLDNYMRSHNPPLHQISYYEFALDQTDVFKMPYYDYSLDKPYAAVFVAMNEGAAQQLFKTGWNEFKSWWYNTTVNPRDFFVNTLEFVPYDEVVEKCDSLN
jgi:hypothetical protein